MVNAMGYKITHRWEILRPPYEPVDDCIVAQIKDIGGNSLKCSCKIHRGKPFCKLHIDIDGQFEQCQMHLVRWAREGLHASAEDHRKISEEYFAEWATK